MRSLILTASLVLASAGASAAPISYTAILSGLNENPDVITPGTGSATVTIDTVAHTLRVQTTFSNLLGTTTASHIHCCATSELTNAGVATQTPSFVGFPLGVTSGSYDQTFDLTLASSWNAAFITSSTTIANAETRLAAALAGLPNAGVAYLNIHTSFAAGGEIRANFVPEPGTFGMLGVALAGLAFWRRKR